jgi:tRNA 2-selenouridine synthase
MQPRMITCSEALASLAQFDAIIDVRSESEYEVDHLPGAVNCPVLSDAERAEIGTIHKQVSPFDARRAGAACVAGNISRHLQHCFSDRPRDWTPLVYCWRGGERSASMAHVMARVGWRVHQLQGGYRAFRRTVVDALETLPRQYHYRVLCGATGSGKSRLLSHLEQVGAQVIDLESLAAHRGSVLGGLPHCPQPSQKQFETRLWWALSRLDPARPVFVESESRRIGLCQLPNALLEAMRQADCVGLDLPVQQRIRLLRGEYRHYEGRPEQLCQQLDGLTALHGRTTVQRWKALAASGEWDALVTCLLQEHYDPVYRRSIRTNYARADQALHLVLDGADGADFDRAARKLVTADLPSARGPVRCGRS